MARSSSLASRTQNSSQTLPSSLPVRAFPPPRAARALSISAMMVPAPPRCSTSTRTAAPLGSSSPLPDRGINSCLSGSSTRLTFNVLTGLSEPGRRRCRCRCGVTVPWLPPPVAPSQSRTATATTSSQVASSSLPRPLPPIR
uniref:Uncharacterized protein n=1 Tax=uncultured marine virus TaxID=186617 RepID=A0A0F7L977_9VIRU|nr:hypothetical protein [uncultured marine virus]